MLEKLDKILLWVLSATLVGEVILNFIGSYGHIYVEGLNYGEHGVDARILPITIDGMLLALAIANVFAARFNRRSKWLRVGLLLGVGGTVAANSAYGANWGMTGGLLSVWAPVALFVTVESGLFVFRIVADLVKEKQAAPALSAPPAGIFPVSMHPVTPDWDVLYSTGQITLDQYRAVKGITESAPVPEPGEGELNSPELEGKDSAPALHLESWRGLNGARVQ